MGARELEIEEEGIGGGGERNVHGVEVPGAHLKQSTITQLLCVERNVCLEEKEKGEAKLGCSLLQEETFPHNPHILRSFFHAHQLHHVPMSVEPVKGALWGHAISNEAGTTDMESHPCLWS